MNPWPRHPVVHEINTWVWLDELRRRHGRAITLATVPAILHRGAEHYAGYGMGKSRGTLPIQLAGNHCNFTAKSSTSTGAMTNTGIEIPVIARPMTTVSSGEFLRSAATIPRLTPTIVASSIARIPSRSEIGNERPMSSLTV